MCHLAEYMGLEVVKEGVLGLDLSLIHICGGIIYLRAGVLYGNIIIQEERKSINFFRLV